MIVVPKVCSTRVQGSHVGLLTPCAGSSLLLGLLVHFACAVQALFLYIVCCQGVILLELFLAAGFCSCPAHAEYCTCQGGQAAAVHACDVQGAAACSKLPLRAGGPAYVAGCWSSYAWQRHTHAQTHCVLAGSIVGFEGFVLSCL